MAINARAVVRVIIEGEWIWVERGTFTVIDFQFEDDDGNLLSQGSDPAYFFLSTNGDPYFGPLAALSLIKLDNQILEESGGEVAEKVKMRAIGPGADKEKEYQGDFAGDEPPGESDEGPSADEQSGKAVPLFAGDADEAGADGDQSEAGDDGDQSEAGERRKGGLF